MDKSKAKLIRNLLFVFGSGIGMGIIFALVMLFYYNPSGGYLAGNVLLAPESATSMRFIDGGSSRGSTHYVLGGIDFIPENKQAISVSMDKYAQFYAIVSNDGSLSDEKGRITSFFKKKLPGSIIVKIKPENGLNGGARPFLTIEFSEDGDHYRVQLREQQMMQGWAYFYHPGIYKKAYNLFEQSL